MDSLCGIALVGCGQIGRVHARRLVDDGRAKIVAVADPRRENAESLAREFAPDAVRAASLGELMTRDDIDAVVLCTPTDRHYDEVREARGRGWPVLCEKPLADTRERIETLVAESGTGPLLSIAYQRRYWSSFRTLRREVLSGRWGAVQAISIVVMERWQPGITGTWRDDPLANPGGFVADAGSHKLDMLFFVTGLEPSESTPLELTARTDRRGSKVMIRAAAIGRLGSVALSLSFVGDAQHTREDFHFHCTGADLLLRDNRLSIVCENRLEPSAAPEPESDPDAAFLDCLLQGAPNQAPAAIALPVWKAQQCFLEGTDQQA